MLLNNYSNSFSQGSDPNENSAPANPNNSPKQLKKNKSGLSRLFCINNNCDNEDDGCNNNGLSFSTLLFFILILLILFNNNR